jgi:hypothetical protein
MTQHSINSLPKWAIARIQESGKVIAELKVERKYWEKRAREAELILNRIGYEGY